MKIIYYTQRGPQHAANQDGLFIQGYSFRWTPRPQTMILPDGHGLFIVVDGMGGQAGGELATEMILQSVAHAHIPGRPDCTTICHLLYAAARDLRHAGQRDYSLAHMGAACAGLWLAGDSAYAFNCGDCRCYEYGQRALRQLTHDHSLAQELCDLGHIDREEARLHPRRNVLLTAISAEPREPEIFCAAAPQRPDQLFLLCTDGLWGEFPHQRLAEILDNGAESAARSLYVAAPGASDDYSFILIEPTAQPRETGQKPA